MWSAVPFWGVRLVRFTSVRHAEQLFQRNRSSLGGIEDCGNQSCHLDLPPQCFCYTVGVGVTHRNSEGQPEVKKQKQKCPLSLLL